MPYCDGIFYEFFNNNLAVVHHIAKSNRASNIVIPAYVKNHKVFRIEEKAFANCRTIERVELPDSLLVVNNSAFRNCPKLKTVVLNGDSLVVQTEAFSKCVKLETICSACFTGTSIRLSGYSAFNGCFELNRFDRIYFLGSIYDSTFRNCLKLQTLRFANGTTLKTNAILGCPSLQDIYIDGKFSACETAKKQLKKFRLFCDETNPIVDWAYEGYCVFVEDNDDLPF